MEPTIGRIVHFVYGGQHLPAIITDPAFDNGDGPAQAMTVFMVSEPPFTTVATEDPNGANGTWHWPEQV